MSVVKIERRHECPVQWFSQWDSVVSIVFSAMINERIEIDETQFNLLP